MTQARTRKYAQAAREIKLGRRYGKPGIWNADGLFADRWSRAVLLSAGYRGNSSVVSLGAGWASADLSRAAPRAAAIYTLTYGDLTSEAHQHWPS
jgi:hypothetical protein